jgi:hypothetical protein
VLDDCGLQVEGAIEPLSIKTELLDGAFLF